MTSAKNTGITVSPRDLPEPGEGVELTIGQYEVLIVNNGERVETEPAVPDEPVGYTAVTGPRVSTVVHASAIYQRAKRTRVARYTLCSRSDSRESGKRLAGSQLTAVTCTQCRRHLESEGVL